MVPLKPEQPRDGEGEQRQHADAAEGGDVARQFLEPTRTQRVRRVARHPQGEQDRGVDGACLALHHLVGKFHEGPGEGRNEQEDDEAAITDKGPQGACRGRATESLPNAVEHRASLPGL